MLYQLSYSRIVPAWDPPPLRNTCPEAADRLRVNGGESRIRTYEAVKQQIYSLPPLATWVSPLVPIHGANGRIRTPDLLITNQLLYQLSYIGLYNKKKNAFQVPFRTGWAGIGPANVVRIPITTKQQGHDFRRGPAPPGLRQQG
jgi:hypothetical protein